MRLGLALLLGSAVALAAAGPAAAQGLGGLTPLPKPTGCLLPGAANGCGEAGPIDLPVDMVIAPDGKTAYVAGYGTATLQVYDVDPASGSISLRPGAGNCFYDLQRSAVPNCTPARGLAQGNDLALSPSGDRLYVAAQNPGGVGIFKRGGDGSLTQESGQAGCIAQTNPASYTTPCRTGVILATARGIAAAGDKVYVTSGLGTQDAGVAILNVVADGLQQAPGAEGCITEGPTGPCKDGRGLTAAEQIVVAPDGNDVYVTGRTVGTVVLLDRASDGTLSPNSTQGGCLAPAGNGLNCLAYPDGGDTSGVAVSQDGRFVYFTTRTGSNTIQVAERASSGTLTPLVGAGSCISGLGSGAVCPLNRGIVTPFRIIEGPEQKHMYVASQGSAVTTYDRTANGGLSPIAGPKGCAFSGSHAGCFTTPALAGPVGLAISPNGRFLYATGAGDDSISVLRRDMSAPTCRDTSATVPSGTAASLQLDCSDADGEPVALSVVSAPQGAVVSAPDPAGKVAFIASVDRNTAMTFTYKGTASGVDSNVATFTVNVTCVPRAEIRGNSLDEDCDGKDLPVVTDGKVRPFWLVFRSYMKLSQLKVSEITAGAKVEIRCSGRGCPFKRRTFTPKRRAVDASKSFRRKRLRPGAKVQVRIVKAGAIAKVVTYTVNRRRKVPRGVVRCLAPGTTKLTTCP